MQVAAALEEAKTAQATLVVLQLDAPGGVISAMPQYEAESIKDILVWLSRTSFSS